MKRRILFASLTIILTFSYISVFGQSALYVTSVQGTQGTPPDDSLRAGQPIVWTIALRNASGSQLIASTNGFQIHDNGTGSEWPIPALDTLDIAPTTSLGWKARYDGGAFTFNDADNNGGVGVRNADTMGLGGFTLFGPGFPHGFDFDVITITVPAPGIDVSHHGKTICLDSARYDVALNEWLWSTTGGGVIPNWAGPHCYTIIDIALGINESITDILPTSFSLDQNYPNPFNPTTNIWFELPQKSYVSLKVFNVMGQEITTLVDETVSAGRHLSIWDGRDRSGSDVASGIYFYKLVADKFVETKKMMLVK